jgi:hypothetical protein
MERDRDSEKIEVLSEKEEAVLCLLRSAVAGIRDCGRTPEVEALERALVDAGALRITGEDEGTSGTFRFRGACFLLRVIPPPCAGIQVDFSPGER